jgi:hypothetical protein
LDLALVGVAGVNAVDDPCDEGPKIQVDMRGMF